MLQEGKNIGEISKRRQAASPGLELSHVMVHDGEQYSPCLIVLEPECSRIEEVSSPSQTANSQVDVTVEIAPIKAIGRSLLVPRLLRVSLPWPVLIDLSC